MSAAASNNHQDEPLAAALWLAEHGFPVFPCWWAVGFNRCGCGNPRCEHPGKHPLTPHGFKDATTDPEQIRKWWGQWPEANLAMPTGSPSGVMVIDFDPRDGAPADREGCAQVIGKIPDEAAEAISGGDGRHICVQYNPALLPAKIAQYIAPGVEVKAEGDYVIVAPSRHKSGKRYEWDGIEGRDNLLHLPLPTPTLLEKIHLASRQKNTPPAEERKWGEGERNNQLTRLAGAMRRLGAEADVIETALQAANREQCQPPLREEEVRKIGESVSRYAPHLVAPDYVIREEAHRGNGSRPQLARVDAPRKRPPEWAGAGELFDGEFPKADSMIDNILYPGVTLLQSPPKLGKSYWALQASLNLIDGTPFMGCFTVPEKHRVLYVDIEGTKSRVHDRLNQLGKLTENSHHLQFLFRPFDPWPNNLQQIEEVIRERGSDVVIFDTFLALLTGPGQGGRDIVRNDYDNIDKIRDICTRNNASALVISHSKKNTEGMSATDAGIHSTGTSASVDSLITLRRLRSGSVMLDVLPRDGEPVAYEVQLDPEGHQGWRILGAGADAGQSKERQAIIEVFRQAENPMFPQDVAESLGKNASTTRTLIRKLAFDGRLESLGNGSYRLREVQS